jgi:hypothetical protein
MLLFISSFYSLYTQADDEGFSSFFNSFFGKELDVAPVKNALYLEECGACHFAYQPGLLPSRSWKKMLSQQEAKNHFEEDITFDDKTVEAQLMHYLTSNAAHDSMHIAQEGFIAFLCIVAIYIIWKEIIDNRHSVKSLEQSLKKVKKDKETYSKQVQVLRVGLLKVLNSQFEQWSLRS